MSTLSIARPEPDESIPYYHRYIEKVPHQDLRDLLLQQMQEVEQLFDTVTDEAALARYAEGKWSVKEVLGHLCDTERIFTYRLLRTARRDRTPMEGYDENAYVPAGQFDERPLPTLLGEFRALRLSTIALLEGLPEGAWNRWGEANGSPVTVRALAYIVVGHVTHHLGVLRERYGLSALSSPVPA